MDPTSQTLAAEIGGEVRALQHLRAGNSSNAVTILEAQLDGALVALHASLSISPSPGDDPFPFEMLELAREYRAKFPHRSNSAEMEKGIADAFRLVAERKKP